MEQISKQSYLDSCDDCEATDRARSVLADAPIGTILYVCQENGPDTTLMQLFTKPHDAASAFVAIPLLWGFEEDDEARIAANFTRQAKLFLANPDTIEGDHYETVGWGGDASCTLYAAEVIE